MLLTTGATTISRDFVAWTQTVPDSPKYQGSGFKQLITNINPTVTQELADTYIQEISEAAKSFPTFCNTGDEEKDIQEFSAFISIVGAETSFSPANGFPCTHETGCPNCEACSYNSAGQLCDKDPKLQYFGRGPL